MAKERTVNELKNLEIDLCLASLPLKRRATIEDIREILKMAYNYGFDAGIKAVQMVEEKEN